MAAAHQYPEYSSGANDYYGSYYNQPTANTYDSNYYSSNGQYNNYSGNHSINHNGPHYQPTNNWQTQSAYTNHQQAQQYYASYSNDQYHSQQYQSQNQQQQVAITSTTSSPVPYNGCSQLNVNHNYAESQKANVTENYQTINKGNEQIEDNKNNPSILNALLSNKKMRYSPSYLANNNQPAAKRARLVASIDNVAMSPNKTEDSLDGYAFGKQPIKAPKLGYEAETVQSMTMQTSLTMTSENQLTNQTQSPMTNYVEGINTPPLSPKETKKNVNQVSENMTDELWAQNESECEYFSSIFSSFFHNS